LSTSEIPELTARKIQELIEGTNQNLTIKHKWEYEMDDMGEQKVSYHDKKKYKYRGKGIDTDEAREIANTVDYLIAVGKENEKQNKGTRNQRTKNTIFEANTV
jgi:hypothetical protein